MLPSVRLRLSQRLKLMLVFCMEPMDMVPVLDMLDLDMDIPVLDMLDMVVMDLAMVVSAMLVLATMARGLLMLSQRLMLVCTMEDMDMVLVWDAGLGYGYSGLGYAGYGGYGLGYGGYGLGYGRTIYG